MSSFLFILSIVWLVYAVLCFIKAHNAYLNYGRFMPEWRVKVSPWWWIATLLSIANVINHWIATLLSISNLINHMIN